ncbi:hypothetical protein NMG29_12040 [Streptomyces cocklensis]|jgi:hypothetical protein|uniref:Cellulose synthase n=1 Tax=Actinacidiphila cocklensis TaxID=887465 RepID=A0A9W4GS59_9ACTN|nr:hypothetical protein [Actinacidiphila cocklensis]MDD1058930.1 hypothetical protein [Actinacidiphila cocklensis]CAG6394428.1 conserved membrane hypothetical protein [Actinacidiphila cocklensis]
MLTTTLCAALSAGGLAIAMLTAYRRRFLAATRIAAASLVPVGLAMAGLVTLGRKVGTATGHWAADLVLKPTVWMGFGVLAVAAMLYGITRLISARLPEGQDRAPAAVPGASTPAIPPGRPAAAGRRGGSDSGLSDFADVEEILKRRGI